MPGMQLSGAFHCLFITVLLDNNAVLTGFGLARTRYLQYCFLCFRQCDLLKFDSKENNVLLIPLLWKSIEDAVLPKGRLKSNWAVLGY